MGKTSPEPPGRGGTTSGFQEHRVHRSDERVLDLAVADVATVDESLGELVGRVA